MINELIQKYTAYVNEHPNDQIIYVLNFKVNDDNVDTETSICIPDSESNITSACWMAFNEVLNTFKEEYQQLPQNEKESKFITSSKLDAQNVVMVFILTKTTQELRIDASIYYGEQMKASELDKMIPDLIDTYLNANTDQGLNLNELDESHQTQVMKAINQIADDLLADKLKKSR